MPSAGGLMEPGKPTLASSREATVVDPALIREALEELRQNQIEFPIRVEGTHTLPYTTHLQRVEPQTSEVFLKLIRPLPHEMIAGAPFEMTFASGEQRFTAPLTFLGREAYLLYRFTLPTRMTQCDRRRNKRYPFRPRERAYVLAQDARLPGHGLSGPLVNLSLNGAAFRVDRILRLDDHLCLPATVGFFERGRELPILKVRDLPKLALFETRGIVTYACERGNEVILGIKFAELMASEASQLQAVLDFRELIQRNPNQSSHRPDITLLPENTPQALSAPARRANPAGNRTPDALAKLGRRCTTILLAMPPGIMRNQVKEWLGSMGYLRLQVEDSLVEAKQHLRGLPDASSPILVAEWPTEPGDTLALLHSFQREVGGSQDLPVILMETEANPAPPGGPLIRALPWPCTDPSQWLPVMDELAGF